MIMKPIKPNLKLTAVTFIPVILLMAAILNSCCPCKKTARTTMVSGDEPFVVVEEMPMFPGGDSALLSYIVNNTKYPESAKYKGIQGKVIIRFCVTKDGGVNRISVLKKVSPELDAEAKRVVSTLPA